MESFTEHGVRPAVKMSRRWMICCDRFPANQELYCTESVLSFCESGFDLLLVMDECLFTACLRQVSESTAQQQCQFVCEGFQPGTRFCQSILLVLS